MTGVGEDGENRDPRALLVGTQIGAATVKNSIEVSQKIKIELPHDPGIPFLGIYLKKKATNLKRHIHSQCS